MDLFKKIAILGVLVQNKDYLVPFLWGNWPNTQKWHNCNIVKIGPKLRLKNITFFCKSEIFAPFVVIKTDMIFQKYPFFTYAPLGYFGPKMGQFWPLFFTFFWKKVQKNSPFLPFFRYFLQRGRKPYFGGFWGYFGAIFGVF